MVPLPLRRARRRRRPDASPRLVRLVAPRPSDHHGRRCRRCCQWCRGRGRRRRRQAGHCVPQGTRRCKRAQGELVRKVSSCLITLATRPKLYRVISGGPLVYRKASIATCCCTCHVLELCCRAKLPAEATFGGATTCWSNMDTRSSGTPRAGCVMVKRTSLSLATTSASAQPAPLAAAAAAASMLIGGARRDETRRRVGATSASGPAERHHALLHTAPD